jgi:catechol 2,3-dioxygenase-like lactoylglutathione lyase family enzyme
MGPVSREIGTCFIFSPKLRVPPLAAARGAGWAFSAYLFRMSVSPLRLDHVAMPCFDLAATDRFYRETLGLELVYAHAGRSAEWGDRRFAIASYRTASGVVLDFFALEGARRTPDDLPADIRHVALDVGSLEVLGAWRERLHADGHPYSFDEHGGAHHSLYVSDPNGHVVELTAWLTRPDASAAAEADAVVRAWIAQEKREG